MEHCMWPGMTCLRVSPILVYFAVGTLALAGRWGGGATTTKKRNIRTTWQYSSVFSVCSPCSWSLRQSPESKTISWVWRYIGWSRVQREAEAASRWLPPGLCGRRRRASPGQSCVGAAGPSAGRPRPSAGGRATASCPPSPQLRRGVCGAAACHRCTNGKRPDQQLWANG